MTTDLARLLGKSIEGISDISDERNGRLDIQLTLSDGSELTITNPEDIDLKEPIVCPRCGKPL